MTESQSPKRGENSSFGARPYEARPSQMSKDGGSLRHRWERARQGTVQIMTLHSPLSELQVDAAAQPSEQTINDEASPLVVDKASMSNSFYVPGVQEHSLNELQATSIAGNDISSSCLYATGIVASSAGKWGPISSTIVCAVLYCFQKIYSEVFSALPMNGGTYNALLNTSNKNMAALAAILSTISYTATAVTSAASAGDYINYQWPSIPSEAICIGILVLFAVLTLLGIKDSANTAAVLFILHLSTMGALVIGSLIYVIRDGGATLKKSWNSDSPEANPRPNVAQDIFFGYCSALLGVTGFESSSNYIEEQKEGVFPKTLRNMWIAITLINPALSVLAMGVIPIEDLVNNANFSLASVAKHAIGDWFRLFVVVDAALVLAGAVLTSYVGITGLHRRLALDRIMPAFFLNVNKLRGSNHFIIITFCVLTTSLRLLVDDMNTLGGVYAIAFLGVMSLFCVSNFLLKFKRNSLPRHPIANVPMVFFAFCMVVTGIIGNLIKSPSNGQYFALYFFVFGLAVLFTKLRVPLLRLIYRMVPESKSNMKLWITEQIRSIREFPVVFFTKTTSLNTLNKVVQYVIDNEDTSVIKFFHFVDDPADLPDDDPSVLRDKEFVSALESACSILDELYPKITIDLHIVYGHFTPMNVARLSDQIHVPRNFMFMTCPSDRFRHEIGQFGGVRVITHGASSKKVSHVEQDI